ncbi:MULTISPECIES: TetR/AcrR family transcriptional regulator [unclassified Conexibacter]|uniref:TetR/AcrR family transcriptional regulator n=1 Tax=unclassified Conexibacter TaxID=2627773 RepID=UPI00351C0E25
MSSPVSPDPSARAGAPGAPAPSVTRERIVHATLRVIAESGIGAVTNRRVATEAGVALGSLTYHFPSQTELLRDSLLRYVEEEVARLGAIAEQLRAASPTPEQVAAVVEQLLDSEPTRPGAISELELHLEASRDPALQEASGRCFAAYEDFGSAILEALEVPEPQRYAPMLVALMAGMTLRRLGTGARDAHGTADALMTIIRGARAGA